MKIVGLSLFQDANQHLFLFQVFNDGLIFEARPVKQDDFVPRLVSHDLNRVMSLISRELDAGALGL